MKSRFIRDLDGKFFCKMEDLKSKRILYNISLAKADLSGVKLPYVKIMNSNLFGANFKGADLSSNYIFDSCAMGASFEGANLHYTKVIGSTFTGINFRGADLSGASFFYTNLSHSDFTDARIDNTDFYKVELTDATGVMFQKLPSISTLSRIYLCNLPDELLLELMRRDAYAHPCIEEFNYWAKYGGCPYKQEERFWTFSPSPSRWESGKPQMTDFEVILEICKSQGWKVKNYLE